MDTTIFRETLAKSPIIAVLRGLAPAKAVAVGEALVAAGVAIMEIPMNKPDAIQCIELLSKALHSKAVIGAGSVTSPQDIGKVSSRGARFIFSPNLDVEVVTVARRLGLSGVPGVATPTEALLALKSNASAIKLFPGELFPPKVITALKAVLPHDALLIVSGGINVGNIRTYHNAGANGYAVSGALFSPEMTPDEVGQKAKKLVAALRAGEASHAHD